MKNHLPKFLLLFFVAAGFLVVAIDDASAQRRGAASKYQIDQTIRRIETNADRFVAQINDSLDRSRLEDTEREDRINQQARLLGDETDKLRREFDRGDSLAENRPYVRRVLNAAKTVNATVKRRKFSRAAEGTWRALRRDFNALARAYGVGGLG